MSIFKKRISNSLDFEKANRINPIDLFKHLTPQEGYNYLRDIQKEFLLRWNDIRDQRDIVGKLNTGAGKTLIALLMLKSKLNEGIGPAVYLCPDQQLVEQVVKQAALFNIPVVTIPYIRNERAEFPIEFLNSEAILVCTFERLFNGRSIFGVVGSGWREIQEIGALVVDDAHSCLKKARKQASIIIRNGTDAYVTLFNLFEEAIREQGEGGLIAIRAGEPSVTRVIPYWAWHQQKHIVLNILSQLYQNEDASVFYNWGLIGDELDQCECFISSEFIEITPLMLPIEKIPSFDKAKHRYILSATFSNDSDLLKEFGLDRSAIENPLIVDNKGDVGERLIITPRRYHLDLNDQLMREVIAEYSQKNNVVVIVPNKNKAKDWKKFSPTLVTKENIGDATEKLKTSQGNLMVFVNRYDGVDLAGKMCTILVLDGLPTAHSLKDKYQQNVREGSPILSAQVAQTIEQGLGRAVRSGSDHCAVFILDNSLNNFIAKNSNKRFFAAETRAQINFGLTLFEEEKPQNAEVAVKEIMDAVNAVLERDQNWRDFHKEMILQVEPNGTEGISFLLELAINEQKSMNLFRRERYTEALDNFLDYIQTYKHQLNEIDEAWYTQFAASLIYPFDPVRSNDMQILAKDKSLMVLKPRHHYLAKNTKIKGRQAGVIKQWITNYGNGTDVLIAIEDLLTNFVYSSHVDSKQFEESVYKIGKFLGFYSQRPEEEEGDGPDNLWRLEDGTNVIIEAKSQRNGLEISRGDIEQLLHSIQWHNDKYGLHQGYIPILFHKGNMSMENAHPSEDSRVMPLVKLEEFKNAIIKFGEVLSSKLPTEWSEREIHQQLAHFKLTYTTLIDRYTERLR
ncbi:DEAD/DEAH box helicase [Bacillus cereus]|uniref:DEAD/DEAH box helicase n=1 Tax=Bacillus cereus TaxID=1396 RepID=UPI0015966F46|nr:DEAD/DEAH box helicase [Bacillus cereus]